MPELVSQRRVLLRGGWAYVSREALAPLVVAEFRTGVSRVRAWRGAGSGAGEGGVAGGV